jgi:hypothetical protein
MPENSSPMTTDPFGFTVIHLRVGVMIGSNHVAQLDIPVTKVLFDEYKTMGEEVAKGYIQHLAIAALHEHIRVVPAAPDWYDYGS